MTALDFCPVNMHWFPLSDVTAINSQDHGEPREIHFSFDFVESKSRHETADLTTYVYGCRPPGASRAPGGGIGTKKSHTTFFSFLVLRLLVGMSFFSAFHPSTALSISLVVENDEGQDVDARIAL